MPSPDAVSELLTTAQNTNNKRTISIRYIVYDLYCMYHFTSNKQQYINLNTLNLNSCLNKKDGYRQLNVRQLGSLRPWDHRSKRYMDRKRIQCLSNASQHVPIYLQPFLRYSKLLVENCFIFTPYPCLVAPQGVTPSEFREDLDTHKTRMNGLSCGEESMTIYSAVLIQYQRVTDRRTDRQTDRRPSYIYYVLQHS